MKFSKALIYSLLIYNCVAFTAIASSLDEKNITNTEHSPKSISQLEPGLGNKAFAWMLDPKFQHNPAAFEKQLQNAVQQLCPNMPSKTLAYDNSYKYPLSNNINDFLSSDNIISLNNNRYVLMRYENLPNFSPFIWVDTQRGTGIVGFYGANNDDLGHIILNITSKNYNSLTIPKEAKRDMMTLPDTAPEIRLSFQVNFFDAKTTKKLVLPKNWLKA